MSLGSSLAEPFSTKRADGWQEEARREDREDIVDASCAEPSEARLRAADACVASSITSRHVKVAEAQANYRAGTCFQEVSRGFSYPFFLRASRSCYHRLLRVRVNLQ